MGVRVETGVGLATAAERVVVYSSSAEAWDGRSRLIIAAHGHGGGAEQWAPSFTGLGVHAAALVLTGRYVVVAIDAGGPTSWGNAASMTAVADARTWAVGRGARAGRYGLAGYSMGGAVALNRLKRDAANVAGAMLWAPLTDLGYANTVNPSWSAEITAAFGSWAATAGYRIADEAASTYADPSLPPVRIVHATDDATVPYSQSTAFAAAAGARVAVRSPAITGGHVGLFTETPVAETVAHFDGCAW